MPGNQVSSIEIAVSCKPGSSSGGAAFHTCSNDHQLYADETSETDEVQEMLSLPSHEQASEGGEVDVVAFKVAYRECFVAAFMADLNQVREDGVNSTLVSYCVESTATSFPPSQREHFLK